MKLAYIELNESVYTYTPVKQPRADVADPEEGMRVLFQHSDDGLKLIVAESGVLTAGWVIGNKASKAW